ncbi:MAG TPA: CapA family protein [Bacillota bacterium]
MRRSRRRSLTGPAVPVLVVLTALALGTLAWTHLRPWPSWAAGRPYLASAEASSGPRLMTFYLTAGSQNRGGSPARDILVPVSRPTPGDKARGYLAIEALLGGPSTGSGLISAIPATVRLNKVSWRGRFAVVDLGGLPGAALPEAAIAQLRETINEGLGGLDQLVVLNDGRPTSGAIEVQPAGSALGGRLYVPLAVGGRLYLGCSDGLDLPADPRLAVDASIRALMAFEAVGRAAMVVPRPGEVSVTRFDQSAGALSLDLVPAYTGRIKERSLRALAIDLLVFNAGQVAGVKAVALTGHGRPLSETWPVSVDRWSWPRWPNPYPAAKDPRPQDARRQATSPRASLTIVGDISLARRIDTLMAERGGDYPLSATADLLRRADIAAANLEAALADTGRPLPNKQIWLRGRPSSVAALSGAGLDAVGLANNHILDYDSEALAQTIEVLMENGLVWFGAGRDLADARRPAFVEAGGVKVAFLAYNEFAPLYFSLDYPRSFEATDRQSGTAPLKPALIEADARAAKAESDAVVIYLHWGVEEADYPRLDQRAMAKGFIEAGADLVAGTHPHVLQGIEFHRDGLIAYSLGNYVYDQRKPRQVESLILTTVIGRGAGAGRGAGPGLSPTVIPVRIDDGQPRPVTGQTAAAQLRRFATLCLPLGTGVGPVVAGQGFDSAPLVASPQP